MITIDISDKNSKNITYGEIKERQAVSIETRYIDSASNVITPVKVSWNVVGKDGSAINNRTFIDLDISDLFLDLTYDDTNVSIHGQTRILLCLAAAFVINGHNTQINTIISIDLKRVVAEFPDLLSQQPVPTVQTATEYLEGEFDPEAEFDPEQEFAEEK